MFWISYEKYQLIIENFSKSGFKSSRDRVTVGKKKIRQLIKKTEC